MTTTIVYAGLAIGAGIAIAITYLATEVRRNSRAIRAAPSKRFVVGPTPESQATDRLTRQMAHNCEVLEGDRDDLVIQTEKNKAEDRILIAGFVNSICLSIDRLASRLPADKKEGKKRGKVTR